MPEPVYELCSNPYHVWQADSYVDAVRRVVAQFLSDSDAWDYANRMVEAYPALEFGVVTHHD